MQQQERILFHEYGTQLRVAADDSLILNVLCGRVAQFGVEFPLNDQEHEEYSRRADAFIRELSAAVRANWESYAARGRTC
jgi:DNA-binding transcriptional LysR family regulator